MAAVTVNAYRANVNGSYRQSFYNLSIATTGDTLTTSMHTIKSVTMNDVAITKAAVSGGVVTFSTTGAVNNALVNIVGL